MRTRAFFRGAGSGALVTLCTLAVFSLGAAWARRSFVPFDLFDAVSRRLPGAWVTRGIDTMVRTLSALGARDLSKSAKRSEHALAVLGVLAAGVGLGALLHLPRWRRRPAALSTGAVAGLAAAALGVWALVSTPPSASAMQLLWMAAVFVAWGTALAWTSVRQEGVGTVHPAEQSDRRRFLVRLAGFTASVTVVGAYVALRSNRTARPIAAGRWSSSNPLPNAGARVHPVPGTRAEFTALEDHYRIDINSMPPQLDGASWRLEVKGLVEQPLKLALDDLKRHPQLDQFVTLSCISNPVGGDLIGTTRWSGVSLQQLLPGLKLKPEATHLKLTAADGFYEVLPLDVVRSDPRVMLTWAWDGVPLTAAHGFPLRVYIPGRYGMKQPKWIESIEALDHWQPGYWVERGWDKEALMKTTSFIDAVDVAHAVADASGAQRVAVGGMAHAGTRGISRVELRLDDGPWQLAALRAPLSATTWVVWRSEVQLPAGAHTLTVRAYDGSGALQIEQGAPPHPSGASGWQSRNA
jgi:DMSO/TMAO reductase YedYZ molybdopterin-dependent catalytic subunit